MRQILIRYWQINTSSNSYYEKTLSTGAVRCIDDEIPFDIPHGWEWVRFRTITRQITDGTHSTPKYVENGVPFISVKDMSSGTICFNSTKFISEDEHKILTARCFPEKGDLLLSKVGTTGVPALVNTETPFSIFVSIALIKFFNKHLNSDYLVYMILSPLVQEQAKKNTRGVGNKNWVLNAISNTLLAIPPHKEQIRVVEKLCLLESHLNKYENLEQRFTCLNDNLVDRLKQSILQEAIQGKLVPQIKSEGTAEDLLEEIRAEKKLLVKERKLNKSAIANESRIFRGDDNKYYEQIDGQFVEIELPFEYPESWIIVRLKEICQLTDGEKKTGKGICLDAKYIRGKSSPTIIEKGRLVLSSDNIILVDGENSGEVFTVPQDGYMGSTFKQLWISSAMWKPYVLAFMLFYKVELRNSKRGAAIPHLNKELFYNLLIGIPPFAEQQRISERINDLLLLFK